MTARRHGLGLLGGLALCLAAVPVVIAGALVATGMAVGVLMLRAGTGTWSSVRATWERRVPRRSRLHALEPDAR